MRRGIRGLKEGVKKWWETGKEEDNISSSFTMESSARFQWLRKFVVMEKEEKEEKEEEEEEELEEQFKEEEEDENKEDEEKKAHWMIGGGRKES
ncbi:uncharacterized protein MONOS_14729 [Monocercomonoides exilis]|uniref:uncharacterized protein n=1 Tax=Monocercomonoides exilis TaxID=2049356 RepID=UPI00355A764A|nr:hypothetical protein MONOS_14729 [Monocercomonoides exilis]|eukprot:MONOS_14729.1-p1 / transcript=MONOS_14729.1 / gene=MONOS_14729 / organism=Monocercomonoides_exilis_PA203 / gene_product=unspecified product / transcript_product=unspecified product / location=Mono_scaffold01060:9750-10031(+) / protein_length=94 / sequence_SO=supercontig / SO=protein_coding / is_pseudo=false